MFYSLKKKFSQAFESLIVNLGKFLTLLTFLSFFVLFFLFFMYLYAGNPIMCLVCIAGIYAFIHLNKVL